MKRAFAALSLIGALAVGITGPAQSHPYFVVVTWPAVAVVVEPSAHTGGGFCGGTGATRTVTVTRISPTPAQSTVYPCPDTAQFVTSTVGALPAVPPSAITAACPHLSGNPVPPTICTVTPNQPGTWAAFGSRDVGTG